MPKVFTADFVYFRLRKGDYPDAARAEIVNGVQALLDSRRDVYVYFKHEEDPRGAIWAEDLLKACMARDGSAQAEGSVVHGRQ